jgi:hypothetical protein
MNATVKNKSAMLLQRCHWFSVDKLNEAINFIVLNATEITAHLKIVVKRDMHFLQCVN